MKTRITVVIDTATAPRMYAAKLNSYLRLEPIAKSKGSIVYAVPTTKALVIAKEVRTIPYVQSVKVGA